MACICKCGSVMAEETRSQLGLATSGWPLILNSSHHSERIGLPPDDSGRPLVPMAIYSDFPGVEWPSHLPILPVLVKRTTVFCGGRAIKPDMSGTSTVFRCGNLRRLNNGLGSENDQPCTRHADETCNKIIEYIQHMQQKMKIVQKPIGEMKSYRKGFTNY